MSISIFRKALLLFSQSRVWPALALGLAALLAYAPALQGEFLWDDHFLVGDNPFFKSPVFALEVFRRYLFLDSFAVYYRPVQNLSYMLDYALCGSEPFGYHLFNIAYHGGAAVLLFALLQRLVPALFSEPNRVRTFAISFGVALIWCVHPIHNAAVAYVSGRADTLAMLLALSAWLLYLKAAPIVSRPLRLAMWGAAWMLALLAICAKEIGFVWMALFAMHQLGFEKKTPVRRRLVAVGTVLSVVAVYALMRHAVALADPRVQIGLAPAQPLAARGILMLRALGDYMSLIFWPVNLHMERAISSIQAYRDSAAWARAIRFEYLSILGILALVGFLWACVKRATGQRARCFGAAWFVLGFLPISNLFPLQAEAAEHWIYMPSIGFLVFLAGCVMALPKRFHALALASVAAAGIPLTMQTAARSAQWADAEVFYKQTMAAGGCSNRVVLNLARVYSARGDFKKAEDVLREAVKRFPGFATARINLGLNLRSQGRDGEAEEFLKFDRADSDKMAKEVPHTWAAALNLAHVRYVAQQTGEALAILDEAIARNPAIWDLVRFKAHIVAETQSPAAAVAVVEPFAAAHWWDYDAFLNLGELRALNGNFDGAVVALKQASRLDIRRAEPLYAMARIELQQGQLAKACEAQLHAMRRAPDQPSQYLFLSSILDGLDRKTEAQQALEKAESLRAAVQARS